MPRVHFVKSARKAIPEYDIKVGDSYYHWKFRYGGKRVSKTYPKPSQLTQSYYLQQLYDIQDRVQSLSNLTDADDLQTEFDNIKSELENLRDEQQSSLDNMPEHLQESSSSGQMLQERIETLENAINDFDGIDVSDYDEMSDDEAKQEIMDERGLDEGDDEDEDEINAITDEEIEEKKNERLQEWLGEKIEEIQQISIE